MGLPMVTTLLLGLGDFLGVLADGAVPCSGGVVSWPSRTTSDVRVSAEEVVVLGVVDLPRELSRAPRPRSREDFRMSWGRGSGVWWTSGVWDLSVSDLPLLLRPRARSTLLSLRLTPRPFGDEASSWWSTSGADRGDLLRLAPRLRLLGRERAVGMTG